MFDFGRALHELKNGRKVARRGWNGKQIFLELQRPDAHSKMTSPYIFIDTTMLQTDNPLAPKCRTPWVASQTDLLAEDWGFAVTCEKDMSEIEREIISEVFGEENADAKLKEFQEFKARLGL